MGESSLKRAIEDVSSLISLSCSIKVFNVKWQVIRMKLEELSSVLIAIESCDSSKNEAVFSSLIPSISVTVNECHRFARRCVDLSYGGKLLMQSDLDVMVAKIDSHVKNINGFYSAGILSHGFAIVVSRPSLGACKDDMRFYIRDLLTRMKIGDLVMKRQALVNFHQVLVDEDGEMYVKILIEFGEIVNVLVRFLDSLEIEIQEQASKIVALISGFDLHKGFLVKSGIIGPLIRVLEDGSDLGKQGAASCLQNLTVNSENAWSVSGHGGVTALLKICSNGEFCGELIGFCCGVLRNLVGVEEIKRFMVDDGAISMFIKLVRSRDDIVQINSIEFLQNIASQDESSRQIVVKEGGIHALVRVLDPKSATSTKTREVSLRAIESLCFSSQNCIHLLMNHGFIDQLLFFLREGEVSVQESALKATSKLCGASEEAKKAMGDAGVMQELVELLDAKSHEVCEMATEALLSLVSVSKNRKLFVQDDRNIGFLLQLLDREEGISGIEKLLLSILMSLTSCNRGRRKIAGSSYLKNIEKLAEAEIPDAKKLVRKLNTNRFRSMLSGLWHS